MILGALAASLSRNTLAGERFIRAGERRIRVGQDF